MKTPLALFRGFQLASGVGTKANRIQQAVLENYFESDRLSKLYQARLLTAAVLGNKEEVQKTLKNLAEVLFPEIGQKREDFRDSALKVMEKWRTKVVQIVTEFKGLDVVRAESSIVDAEKVAEEVRMIAKLSMDRKRRKR